MLVPLHYVSVIKLLLNTIKMNEKVELPVKTVSKHLLFLNHFQCGYICTCGPYGTLSHRSASECFRGLSWAPLITQVCKEPRRHGVLYPGGFDLLVLDCNFLWIHQAYALNSYLLNYTRQVNFNIKYYKFTKRIWEENKSYYIVKFYVFLIYPQRGMKV